MFVTLTDGHQMMQDAYNARLDHFASLLNTGRNKVITKVGVQELIGYDYSYLIDRQESISSDVISKFGQAGLKTEVEQLTGHTYVVRLKY